MRTMISCFVVILLFAACPNAYRRITHGFRPAKCLLNWPEKPEWENAPLHLEKQQQIQAILQQPFSYFSKGKQCFVFLSQDGKHVLKLFRFDGSKIPYGQMIAHRIKKWSRESLADPLPLRTKVPKTLSSCKIAYDRATDLTGLVHVHLNPKKSFFPALWIKDRLGRLHQLDPSAFRFILQKKCDPLFPTLLKATPEEREGLISSFSHLIDRLENLGFKNIDPKLGSNFGFLEGKAIVIDVGNFAYDPIHAKEDRTIFIPRLNRCLQSKLALLENQQNAL